MSTGQDSDRDIVHTRGQLESLPVGTTLVDKSGVGGGPALLRLRGQRWR
ncbi:hypothetical protein J2X46_003983 [Nocardioides sp. BE266]|nr:hypothetical protein [Nocardioides sp. BE266]